MRYLRPVTGLAVLVLLLVAACSDADEDPAPTSSATAAATTTAAATATEPSEPANTPTLPAAAEATEYLPLTGFVGDADLPDHGSAGFILMEGAYHFIQAPGAEDSSIAFIDAAAGIAYGWSRDLPADDPDATQWSWVLDLDAGTFTDIDIEGATWAVARNGSPAGPLVGKLANDGGTPEDDSDDAARGFIHDPATGETEHVAREGFEDIGFTGINGDGVITGFNDFGVLGFVYRDGEFVDLTHPDAFRLFPFQINDAGAIVGFWGVDEDTWYLNAVSPAFIGQWDGDGYTVERYAVPGFSGTGLSALNNHGVLGGMLYETPESTPVVFIAPDATRLPELYPLPAHMSPFLTGLTDGGTGYGQVFLSEPEEVALADDADPELVALGEELVQEARELSGPAHSGPFSRVIHGLFHQVEDPAVAARDALVAGDPAQAPTHLDELDAALADTRTAVLESPDAGTPEGEDLIAILDAIGEAAGALRSALAE